MPYTNNKPPCEYRDKIDAELDILISKLCHDIPASKRKGVINYIIHALIIHCLLNGGSGYTEISNAIGVCSDVEGEMRRRILNPYEDKMIVENGDTRDYQYILEVLGLKP
jgi:hypothetical protein